MLKIKMSTNQKYPFKCVNIGDLFEYNGLLCIKTDKQDEDKDNELIYDLCVILATGKLVPILDCTYINEVELIGIYGDDGVLNYTTKK